jgi:hypothetical protein
MRTRVLDLDGGVGRQRQLLDRCRPEVVPLQHWGPSIRLACTFGKFRRFEQALEVFLGRDDGRGPLLTFCGSGDFHHVSLALLRRLDAPFNLLVLDNHPDWMRRVPLMHCGTWLHHALGLPLLQHVFHAGGDVDFDNGYRFLAPWQELRDGKVRVLPAVRRYRCGPWRGVPHEPLRPEARFPLTAARVAALLRPHAVELARWPLYVSLDKDVMVPVDSVVNWDSGHLGLPEVCAVLRAFVEAAGGRLAGMDVVGDWSPVCVCGGFRRLLHWTEHPGQTVPPDEATRRNEGTNLALLDCLEELLGSRPCRLAA